MYNFTLSVLSFFSVAGCGRHPRPRYDHRDDDTRVGRHRRGEGAGAGAPSGWGRGRGRARPFFDDSTSSGNITLIEGQTAMMECVVKNVGNKSVSQISRIDIMIHSYRLSIVNL